MGWKSTAMYGRARSLLRLRRLAVSQSGMIEAIAIAGLGVAVSVGVIYVAGKFKSTMITAEKRKGSTSEIEMVMSRVSQAVGVNAILCAAALPGVRSTHLCRWSSNSNLRPTDFGFENVPTTPTQVFEFKAKGCIPRDGDPASLDCRPTVADVSLEMVNTDPMLGLFRGARRTGDEDVWAIKMKVKLETKVEGKVVIKESSALLRRPRLFVRFEIG